MIFFLIFQGLTIQEPEGGQSLWLFLFPVCYFIGLFLFLVFTDYYVSLSHAIFHIILDSDGFEYIFELFFVE